MSKLTHVQSALHPRGDEAQTIAEITQVLVVGGALVFIVVLVLAAYAVFAPRPWLSSTRLVIAGGIVFPLIVLTGLLLYTIPAAPRGIPATGATFAIEIVGHQWWWELNYLDRNGRVEFTTANELHLPVGQHVEIRLRSADVLHSFWVPALAGKLDLIPGRVNRLTVRAGSSGVFRGQCAEYCGGPHAHMAIWAIAEDAATFERWRAAQRAVQVAGATPALMAGEQLFMMRCAACHTVRGTRAAGRLGPDLTHLASRRFLGSGILLNSEGSTAGWVTGNQHLKPGNLMPEFRSFTPDELKALVDYLRSLH